MGEPSGWQVAGTASEMHERYIIPAFITTYQELVALAALQGGERVLEVACGTGMVARLAAQVVGTAGHVVGADVNERGTIQISGQHVKREERHSRGLKRS